MLKFLSSASDEKMWLRFPKPKALLISSLLAAALLIISGCSTSPVSDSNLDADTPQGQTAAKMHDIIEPIVSKDEAPNSDKIKSALKNGGINTEKLETQHSTTPTGLQVDSLSMAVPVDDQCVFAYIRDKKVSMSVLPKLQDQLCFVGDQR